MKKLSPLAEQFFELGKVEDCPVYDLHGHMGPFYGIHMPEAHPDDAVRAMDRANVRMLVFCHHAALLAPDTGNMANVEAARRHPNKLKAYCGINPNYPEAIEQDLASYDEYPDVYVGLKMLADYHCYPLTDARYHPAWEMAEQRMLPVLLHTWGGSQYNGQEVVREVARKYPNTKIIMGHSIHGNWDVAAAIVNDFPNVYCELCAVVDERGALEELVEHAGSERILFGTDYPWFDFHYYIGAILGADITDEDRRNIFHRNAEKLLGV